MGVLGRAGLICVLLPLLLGLNATAGEGEPPARPAGVVAMETQAMTLAAMQRADIEKFSTKQIRLFYFTDIDLLIRTLNPRAVEIDSAADANVRVQRAEDAVAAQLKVVEAAGVAARAAGSAKAAAAVNLQGAVDQAALDKAAADAQANVVSAEKGKLATLSADALKATEAYSAAPASAELKQAAEDAQAAVDTQQEVVEAAEAKQAELAETAAVSSKAVTDSGPESLQGLLTAAETKLAEESAKLADLEGALLSLEDAVIVANAQRRDNQPFWLGPLVRDSPNPLDNVIIYGFPDSNTLILRGQDGDVREVQKMIAEYDRPAPQTRLTLWTLELNGVGDKKGIKRFNESLEMTEKEFRDTREDIAAALSLLRDITVDEVRKAEKTSPEIRGRYDSQPKITVRTDGLPREYPMSRFFFYEDEVLERLGLAKDFRHTSSEIHALMEEGWWDKFYFTRYVIPDPASASTLGEILMVLALAKDSHRMEVMRRFEAAMTARETSAERCQEIKFRRLRRALAADVDLESEEGLNGVQLTITNALQRQAFDQLIPFVTRAAKLEGAQVLGDLSSNALMGALARSKSAGNSYIKGDRSSQEAVATDSAVIRDNFKNLQRWIYSETGQRLSPEEIESIVRRHDSFYSPNQVAPDIAKGDELLKVINIAMEDDLDELFVAPMLHRLREGLQARGINVGVVQRTSLLATNRSLAQINPRSSADLRIGEDDDILAAAQQFSQLLPVFSAGGEGKRRDRFLGGLSGLPAEEDTSEIYGITSGNAFKVTPIFDPTGQALRFKFDHLYANRIRDPDNSSGGLDRRLPRIEAVGVNTEVQVSNFEIREVARYENNVKLGLVPKKSGGIPILKDVPIFEDIPLIGWFKRRSGQEAVIQESIIFAQSAMYPSIGDILDVLTQPIPDVQFLRNDPEYLNDETAPPPPTIYTWAGKVLFKKKVGRKDQDIVDPNYQVYVEMEQLPGESLSVRDRTWLGTVSADGNFAVPFVWERPRRYRLVVTSEVAERSNVTDYRYIPLIDGKNPTFRLLQKDAAGNEVDLPIHLRYRGVK